MVYAPMAQSIRSVDSPPTVSPVDSATHILRNTTSCLHRAQPVRRICLRHHHRLSALVGSSPPRLYLTVFIISFFPHPCNRESKKYESFFINFFGISCGFLQNPLLALSKHPPVWYTTYKVSPGFVERSFTYAYLCCNPPPHPPYHP